MSKSILFKNISIQVDGDVDRLSRNAIIVDNKRGFSRIVLNAKKGKFTIIIRGN